MTWIVYSIDGDHTGIEFGAFRTPEMRVVSEHVEIGAARQALVDYRERQDREAAEAAGQRSLFDEA